MHISDVHDYCGDEKHAAATEPFLEQNRAKGIKREIEQLVDDEFERLQEYANTYISDIAAGRAERFLEKVLSGEKDAAMALLGSRSGGDRYEEYGPTPGKPWAKLIHGKLFETNGIELRRKIVEANTDLIVSERIADLESIVSGSDRANTETPIPTSTKGVRVMLSERTNVTAAAVRAELAELTETYRTRKRALNALLRCLESEAVEKPEPEEEEAE